MAYENSIFSYDLTTACSDLDFENALWLYDINKVYINSRKAIIEAYTDKNTKSEAVLESQLRVIQEDAENGVIAKIKSFLKYLSEKLKHIWLRIHAFILNIVQTNQEFLEKYKAKAMQYTGKVEYEGYDIRRINMFIGLPDEIFKNFERELVRLDTPLHDLPTADINRPENNQQHDEEGLPIFNAGIPDDKAAYYTYLVNADGLGNGVMADANPDTNPQTFQNDFLKFILQEKGKYSTNATTAITTLENIMRVPKSGTMSKHFALWATELRTRFQHAFTKQGTNYSNLTMCISLLSSLCSKCLAVASIVVDTGMIQCRKIIKQICRKVDENT